MTIDDLRAIQQNLISVWGRTETLTEFVRIFISLSEADRLHACYELDSNLVFSNGGCINFSRIARSIEHKLPDLFAAFEAHLPVASSVQDACPRQRGCFVGKKRKPLYFALLTDVDDTLLPSADTLGLGGCDTSWHRDGTLYPGMAGLHRALRGDDFPNNQLGSRGYSVCLTARPAALVRGLGDKFQRLGPRLSILPGKVADNVVTTNMSRYDNYAKSKLEQFNRYFRWFRHENFVFFGDTGQGDVKVAEELLANPRVAFCAIHVISPASPKRPRSSIEEAELAQEIFGTYTSSPEAIRLCSAFPDRLFFYNTTLDLAAQLDDAQWISAESAHTVRSCYYRDRCEEAVACAKHLNLRSLEQIMETRVGPSLDLWEVEQVAKASRFADQLREIRKNTDPIIVSSESGNLCVDITRVMATLTSASSDLTSSQKKPSIFGRVLQMKRHLVQSKTYCTCTLKCGSRTVQDLGRTENAVRDARGIVSWPQNIMTVPLACVLESDHLAFTIYTDYLYAKWTTTRIGSTVVPIVYTPGVHEAEKRRCRIYLPSADSIGDAVGTLDVKITFVD